MRRTNTTPAIPEAIYRSLLLVYPADFRSEYGQEMMQIFRARFRTARGLPAHITLWCKVLADLAATAPGEQMDTLKRDLHYALRIMARRPAFTALAVAALAIGIGSTTAIFSVVNGTMLRPLPYRDAHELVWISGANLPAGIAEESASGPDFLDWHDQNRSLEAMTCLSNWQPVLTNQGPPERIPGGAVSSSFFRVLGVPALLGRTFAPEDDAPARSQVVVLSYGTWHRLFGGDPQVPGKTVTLNGNPYTVIGVMPADFLYPSASDSGIWTVYDRSTLAKRGRRSDHLGVIGRLRPGIAVSQAQADLNAIAASLEARFPDTNTNWRVKLMPLLDRAVGRMKQPLLMLLGAVGVLLLIACTNVASLLLVRGMARQREIALRTALGAARRSVVRQLLTESVLLSAIGGALGLGLAYLGVRGLIAISPADVPRIRDVRIDSIVLGFVTVTSVVTGVFFGLVPALQLSAPDMAAGLREGARGATHGKRSVRMRNALTAAELALAVVLLIGAGLLARSYLRLLSVNPGFRSAGLLTFRLSLPQAKYSEGAQFAAFYERVLQRMKSVPGIVDVCASSDPPFLAANYWAFVVQGRPPLPPGTNQDAQANIVTPDYFRVMGITLLKGRTFGGADGGGSARVALISESMARRYWAGSDPIGQRIAFDSTEDRPNWREIAGVVADTRSESLGELPYPQMYVPYAQLPQRSMTVMVHTAVEPKSVLRDVRSAVLSIDREQPLHGVQTMNEVLAASIAQQQLSVLLLGIFASLALILAAIGVYGVTSHSVGQRTQEMGIRIALGARPFDVLKTIMGEGILVAAIGIVAGCCAASWLARLISGLLFGIEVLDPVAFLAIPAILCLVALIACYVPARKATRVDAFLALRE